MRPPISVDSLDRYARIIRALIPNADGVSICSVDGIPIQSLDFAGDAELLPAVERLTARRPDWASKQQFELQSAPGEERSLLTAGLCDVHSKVIAAVAVLTNGKAQRDSLAPLLSCVIECVQHEMVQDLELESIADELMERYEELNLVYHTEDQVNYFRQGREALESLTQNCLDYLNVGLSVMILKDKDITISFNHHRNPIPNAKFVKSHLAGSLYDWVFENSKSIVVNEMSDPMAVRLLPGVPCRVLCCPILDSAGDVVGILATANDYAKTKFSNSDKNLLHVMARKASKIIVANYDPLTGLMNRGGYEHFLENALTHAQSGDVETCLLHINIDQLHIVNDTVGHAAGDAIIQSVGATLESQVRDGDTLSRLGGDEFGVLLQNCSFANAADFANRVCRTIADTEVNFESRIFKATVSIGVAMMTSTSNSVAQVVGTAELACSVAKDQGQNRVEAYRVDDADMIRREEQMHLVAEIQRALTEDSFELYCQPIQSLDPDNRTHHTEILLRLLDKDGAILAPGNFIPAAERYHLMPAVDRWVVSKTLAMLSEFDESQLRAGMFAINLSGQSLNEKDFLRFVHTELGASTVPAKCICFEVTETAAVSHLAKAIGFMDSLKRIGCSFSLDDFGSGISSFGYLKSLPVDYLKIDGSIVKDIVTDETSAAMVTAINQVGHTMQLLTIAEFVENDSIKSCLTKIGVDYVQGYGIGRPEPFAGRLRELMLSSAEVAS
ncbi:MAG: EAL domain-containing protein [Gammaproteobacteria bacterium]|nr:EAL domain-containing protein [Gammaproteobacteria bacterium]MDH3416538.1 EAL domain-containing protein [Gammaproteobacteria bacterium]